MYMFDTFNIFSNIAPAQNALAKLENIEEVLSEQRGHVLRGHVGNYVAVCDARGLFLSGSLSKYLNGENLTTISRADAVRGVEDLSDFFGVDLQGARLCRVDFAATFGVARPVEDYFCELVSLPRFERVRTAAGGLTFAQKKRALYFYDKGREMGRAGRVHIPPEYDDKTLLRYEMRLFRTKLFGLTSVADALSVEGYGRAVALWRDSYQRIEKSTGFTGMGEIKNGKEAERAFVAALLQDRDAAEDFVNRFIAQLRAQSKLDRSTIYRVQKRLEALLQARAMISAAGCVEELSKQVDAQAARELSKN